MNDTQILTLATSVIVPVSFLLLSNSRITDVKETLRAEVQTAKTELRSDMESLKTDMQSMKTELRSEMQSLKSEIFSRFDRLDDNLTRLLADHDHRIAKLEAERR
jgi:predicted nuclease with TOPRIM domain